MRVCGGCGLMRECGVWDNTLYQWHITNTLWQDHTPSRSHPLTRYFITYMQGFIQDFLLGRGKKIMQGYSCQHLIKSLNKSHLVMCIVIEGPDLKEVNFNHIFKAIA